MPLGGGCTMAARPGPSKAPKSFCAPRATKMSQRSRARRAERCPRTGGLAIQVWTDSYSTSFRGDQSFVLRICRGTGFVRVLSPAEPPDNVEEHGRENNPEQGHTDHAGEDRRAEGAAHLGAGPLGDHQRERVNNRRGG